MQEENKDISRGNNDGIFTSVHGKELISMKKYRFLIILSCISLSLMLMSGCALNNKPLFPEYDQEGKPVTEKRYRRHVARDFLVHWSKKAYHKNDTSGPHFLLSEDQQMVKDKYGPPDYISVNYKSRRGDYVTEWLYWKEGVMFQYVNRILVYSGKLTDKERVLVVYGLPDKAQIYQHSGAIERENFYYGTLFGVSKRNFMFVNGDCATSIYYD